MSKKQKTFSMFDISSEKDLKDLAPDYNYKLFKTDDSGKPVSYVVYGTNCRSLVAYHHQTQKPLYDTFDKMFCFVDDNQTENPLAYVIQNGRIYDALTYYHCMFNENDFTNNFVTDSQIFDLSESLEKIPSEFAAEATEIFNSHIVDSLNSSVIDTLRETVFDYCSMYNFVIQDDGTPHDRRLQFMKSYPFLIDFYHLFTDKYMIITPTKLSTEYEVFNVNLTPEKQNYNDQMEFKFTDVENGIDNGSPALDIIDVILNNPKRKCVTKEEYLPENGIYVDMNMPHAKQQFNALFKDNIFDIKHEVFLKESSTYRHLDALEGLDPNHYHLFKGKLENLEAIKELLKKIDDVIPSDEQLDINEYLKRCDNDYISEMTTTNVNTMIEDVIGVVEKMQNFSDSCEATKGIVERMQKRNSMKLWHNLNSAFHTFAPYMSDFEKSLLSISNKCYEIDFDVILSDEKLRKNVEISNFFKFIEDKGYEITQLISVDDFKKEGEKMDHCVGSYYSNCLGTASFIFSLKDDKGNMSTCQFKGDNQGLKPYQHYGKGNSNPSNSLRDFATLIAKVITNSKEIMEDIKVLHANTERAENNMAVSESERVKSLVMITKLFIPQLFKDKNQQLELINSLRNGFDYSPIKDDLFESYIQDCLDAVRIDDQQTQQVESVA